jgi:nucleotide-binding universal stress UspA family protein
MELLRKCPAPVWLIGSSEQHRRPKRILAAVHPERADAVEQALNRRLVEAALLVAALTRGEVTVLTCWQPFGLTLLESRMTAAELADVADRARAQAEAEFEDFARTIKDEIAKCRVRLVRGDPQDVIPRYAARHDADLVVMGTIGRGGLVGMIMGNTAERILHKLRCSVLALKPEGFESPASLRD